jgi:hypothetical protein
MVAIRALHIREIDKHIALTDKVKKNPLRNQIHAMLRDPNNYELIFGRVHTHHHATINKLLKPQLKINTNHNR